MCWSWRSHKLTFVILLVLSRKLTNAGRTLIRMVSRLWGVSPPHLTWRDVMTHSHTQPKAVPGCARGNRSCSWKNEVGWWVKIFHLTVAWWAFEVYCLSTKWLIEFLISNDINLIGVRYLSADTCDKNDNESVKTCVFCFILGDWRCVVKLTLRSTAIWCRFDCYTHYSHTLNTGKIPSNTEQPHLELSM